MTEHVKGKAVHIFFEAPNSFYKVLLVKIKEASFQWNEKQITVVGNFADIIEGNEYSFEGRLTKHARYGMQKRLRRPMGWFRICHRIFSPESAKKQLNIS